MVTTADYWPVMVTFIAPPVCLFVQEHGAEKKVMDHTARAWYKGNEYSVKLNRIVDHNEGPQKYRGKRICLPRYCQEYRGNFSVAPVGSAPMPIPGRSNK